MNEVDVSVFKFCVSIVEYDCEDMYVDDVIVKCVGCVVVFFDCV